MKLYPHSSFQGGGVWCLKQVAKRGQSLGWRLTVSCPTKSCSLLLSSMRSCCQHHPAPPSTCLRLENEEESSAGEEAWRKNGLVGTVLHTSCMPSQWATQGQKQRSAAPSAGSLPLAPLRHAPMPHRAPFCTGERKSGWAKQCSCLGEASCLVATLFPCTSTAPGEGQFYTGAHASAKFSILLPPPRLECH